MPAVRLPNEPNLEQLKNQAKTLQKFVRAQVPQAVDLVREFHPRLSTVALDPAQLAGFRLVDAQLVVARRYGFGSWARLRRYLDVVARFARSPHQEPVGGPLTSPTEWADEFLRLACLTHGGDDPAAGVRMAAELLAAHPEMASASIYTAAAVGDVEAARRHLELDPGLADREGGPYRWPPLLYLAYSAMDGASGCAHVDVARLLLDAGADPDSGYLWEGLPSPHTALTGAFGPHGHSLRLARLFLERGADANDSQALYELSEGDDPEPLALLLEFGLGSGTGGPWHARLAPAHPTGAQLVEDELVKAAARNWPRRAAVVLTHGVDVNGRGTNHPLFEGRRPYELAVLDGSAEVEDLLRAAGAGPAPPDPVLDFLGACTRADRPAVDRMRQEDPTIVERAKASRPHHLSAAADQDRLDAVTLMVELGFDVNASHRYPHAQTALHGAAYNGNLAMVEYLVAHGADPTLEDCSFHATPLGWAEHNNQRHVVEFLSTRSEPRNR